MSSPDRSFRNPPWKILSSRPVIQSAHLQIRADTVELPDGTVVDDYFVQETRGYSIIFAITVDGNVVLVRQYKHGIGAMVVELPAGSIDAGENAAACAARELAEETGYVGDAPEYVGSFATNPTGSNGRFHLYIVRNATPRVAQHFDVTEDIEVEIVDFTRLRDYVRDGTIETTTQIMSILYILDAATYGKLSLRPGSLPA